MTYSYLWFTTLEYHHWYQAFLCWYIYIYAYVTWLFTKLHCFTYVSNCNVIHPKIHHWEWLIIECELPFTLHHHFFNVRQLPWFDHKSGNHHVNIDHRIMSDTILPDYPDFICVSKANPSGIAPKKNLPSSLEELLQWPQRRPKMSKAPENAGIYGHVKQRIGLWR